MPHIVNFAQGSQEWLDWRNGGIGGSDLPVIMCVSPYSKPEKLWDEKKTGFSGFAGNWATDRGQRLEPEARRLAEIALKGIGCDVQLFPLCFQDEDAPWKRVSMDGFGIDNAFCIEESVGVELKCLGREAHLAAVESGKIPAHYLPQLGWQRHVAKLDKQFVGFFNPDVDEDKQFILLEWECPAGYMDAVVSAATDFWNSLLAEDNPYRKAVVLSDDWIQATERYKRAKEAEEAAKVALEDARDMLLALANGNEASGNGVSVSRVVSKGTIDWARFQKENPDLKEKAEAYRKEASTSFRINIEKENE